MSENGDQTRRKAVRRIGVLIVVGCIGCATLLGLFVLNGTVLALNDEPEIVTATHPAAPFLNRDEEIRIVAYNIAKAFVHHGGLKFSESEVVRTRLDQMAEVIRREDPNLVFLSETIRECAPSPVNQVAYLAEQTGMHSWAFGECYNIGLPFYRIVGGNAILSRWPLTGVTNLNLAGRKPFYVTRNNRRALFCETRIGDNSVLLGSFHNDSFSLTNNAAQSRQILNFLGSRSAVLAGDFNARPDSDSVKQFKDNGRFTGEWSGAHTYPSDSPDRTIDYVLAPVDWKLIRHRVITNDASDHYAIVSEFRLMK